MTLTTTMTLHLQFLQQQPPSLSYLSQPRFQISCTLTKQGQRFLTKLTTTTTTTTAITTNTSTLIQKFVQSSPKSVVLSTLTHLLSPTTSTSHPNLSSLALPLYTTITQTPWFTWNPTIVANLIALLHQHAHYTESQTLISETTSKLNKERDLLLFYCKLLESHSKRPSSSQSGFDFAYSYLNNLLHTSSSVYVKRKASQYMISGLCAIDKPREAENLIRDCNDGGIQLQPSDFEFKCIVYGYGRLGLFSDLLRVVNLMEKSGFVIDTVCYNMVLSSYGIHGEYVEMVSWLRKMRNSGVPFSIRTYNSVSNYCPNIMNQNRMALSIHELNSRLQGGEEAMVVRELLECSAILEEVMVWDSSEVKLDLHGFHLGSAYLVMLLWLEEMQKRLLLLNLNHDDDSNNYGIPQQVTVICGLGKHSSVRGESPVKVLVKKMVMEMRSPLRIDRKNNGCFIAKGNAFKNWLSDFRKPIIREQ